MVHIAPSFTDSELYAVYQDGTLQYVGTYEECNKYIGRVGPCSTKDYFAAHYNTLPFMCCGCGALVEERKQRMALMGVEASEFFEGSGRTFLIVPALVDHYTTIDGEVTLEDLLKVFTEAADTLEGNSMERIRVRELYRHLEHGYLAGAKYYYDNFPLVTNDLLLEAWDLAGKCLAGHASFERPARTPYSSTTTRPQFALVE